MTARIIVGLQWGDEGKGKIVDYLSSKTDVVARFQGGHNAGHTIEVGGNKVVLHLLPSGALRPKVECYIGNGVVLSIQHLFEELAILEQQGVQLRERLFVSSLCPLLFSCHQLLDEAREMQRHGKHIGTTLRGIGPAYEDKVARRGLRLSHLIDMDEFARQLRALFEYHNFFLKHYYHHTLADVEEELQYIRAQRDDILDMMFDVSQRLAQLTAQGKDILYEGAQGSLLDIDHGTYPYVTSSNTIAGNVALGCGVDTSSIAHVIGVCKAYATRVGEGPFPSESTDAAGEHLAERGHEFGATTARARRCGWLDLVALKHALRINGVTSLCMTKLDVLSGLSQLKVCTDYTCTADTHSGKHNSKNYTADRYQSYQPVYTELEPWQEDISNVRSFGDLPTVVQNYLRFIEEAVDTPIDIVSVSPKRDGNIIMRPW